MKRKFDKNKLLWIDLEMTGLDPERCKITEVGIIITDYELNEITTYQTTIKQPLEVIEAADQWVKDNMAELIETSQNEGKDESEVTAVILALIEEHFDEAPILAGNSIHQDRRFIRKWWPEIEQKLHYRMLDVSSWKVYMAGRYDEEFKKAEQHRALEDIRGSIEELRFYLEKLPELQS